MGKIVFLLLMPISIEIMAENATNVWAPAAKVVCTQIDNALNLYQKGDLKNAHLEAIMSYFKGYDAEIEPAARITIGGPHVFEVERQFRDFAGAMTPNPDKNQLIKVSDLANKLCKAVSDDAKILHDAKIPHQVFKVDI